MKHWLAIVLALAPLDPALAQLRTIPKEAKLGQLRHLQDMYVEIDGKPRQLSPGAQIRDPDNRLVVPTSLAERAPVFYLVDGMGLVHRVWILSATEKAKLPPPPFPK
ncbi:MAG TPA: hypothetical protein VFB93_18200 [Burkholderiales bacterium]|nr:hypothetical protein [Burkholderiales bacterium]